MMDSETEAGTSEASMRTVWLTFRERRRAEAGKAFGFDGQGISPDGQHIQMKDTVTARALRGLRVGGDIGRGDGCAQDRCAGSIRDPAFNVADRRLRQEYGRKHCKR